MTELAAHVRADVDDLTRPTTPTPEMPTRLTSSPHTHGLHVDRVPPPPVPRQAKTLLGHGHVLYGHRVAQVESRENHSHRQPFHKLVLLDHYLDIH